MNNHNDDIKLESNEQYGLLGLDTGNQGNTSASTPGSTSSFRSISSKQRWNESPEARARRLARNAERMRERRARESEDEYRSRLSRNAEANRLRRQGENDVERAMRLVRNAARQRLRRAMESPEQRAKRLAKLAERMRIYRANETPEQRKERLAEMAARARERIARETSEERKERLRKLSEYAKKVRSNKSNIKTENTNTNHNQNPNQNNMQHGADSQIGQQQDHQQLQQDQQNYPPQTLTNSIEYYQNMFINSALRPNLTKDLQSQLHATQNQIQLPRFSQNTQTISIDPTLPANLFQPTVYDNAKPVQKFQQVPYQTLTSSIEYYQNKFIKNDKNEQSKDSSPHHDDKRKKTDNNINPSNISPQQQTANSTTPLYNQFTYLNNFSTASSPTNNQQNYYPMYHNGFQLAIAPNTVPPPFTPVHFQNTNIQQQSSHSYNLLNNSSPQAQNQQQLVQDFPKPVRGRPKKIFPDNEITRIPAELQEEAIRQHKVNALLENEINQMLASPKRCRGRPGRGQETDQERQVRLQKMAAHQRRVRANESSEERAIRLKKLSERARMKRQQVRDTETEDERRDRRAKQAEYARLRRLKAQNPESKKRMEEQAKELYAQLHNLTTSQQAALDHQHQHHNQPHANTSSGVITSDDFVKNPGKDFAQSENNDVLKILQPIIVMKAK